MKQYTLLIDHDNLRQNDELLPCPGFNPPVPFATQSEISKEGGPKNMWYESFLIKHPEIFKQVTQ